MPPKRRVEQQESQEQPAEKRVDYGELEASEILRLTLQNHQIKEDYEKVRGRLDQLQGRYDTLNGSFQRLRASHEALGADLKIADTDGKKSVVMNAALVHDLVKEQAANNEKDAKIAEMESVLSKYREHFSHYNKEMCKYSEHLSRFNKDFNSTMFKLDPELKKDASATGHNLNVTRPPPPPSSSLPGTHSDQATSSGSSTSASAKHDHSRR